MLTDYHELRKSGIFTDWEVTDQVGQKLGPEREGLKHIDA